MFLLVLPGGLFYPYAMVWNIIIAICLGVAILSYLTTGWLRDFLLNRRVFDVPTERSNHTQPIPKGGGLAIIGAIIAGHLALSVFGITWLQPYWPVFVSALFLASISWWDDLKGLPVLWRLTAHIAVVTATLALMPEHILVFQGILPVWADKLAVGLLWVWFINLYNFMDGIDGITASETLALCAGIALVGWMMDINSVVLSSLIIAAAIIGFLPWNWHPAKLFMGDTGSISLGFLVGWLLIEIAMTGYWVVALILPAYYLADSGITLLKRLSEGKKIWQAHSEHYYQYAVRQGRPHHHVVMGVSACNIILISIALLSTIHIAPFWVFLLLGIIAAVSMLYWLRNAQLVTLPVKKAYIAALHDAVMAGISFVLALYLRFDMEGFHKTEPYLVPGVILFMLTSAAVFIALRVYRRSWRYVSVQDLSAIAQAVTLSILIFIPIMFIYNRLEGMPRSAILINWLVMMVLIGGSRFLYRVVRQRTLTIPETSKISVLLVGANDYTELFLRETVGNRHSDYRVVGLVDDDPAKIGQMIRNIHVYGSVANIESIVEKLRSQDKTPQKIIIAPDMIKGADVRKLVHIADQYGMTVGRLPRLTEFHQTETHHLEMRPIMLEDLLGRPQKVLDRGAMKTLIQGKRVLVTGAGGTIGSELCRQICSYEPSHITLLDHSEHNLYQIEKALEEHYPNISYRALIADICNKSSLTLIWEQEQPQLVFHAAALKHVPMSEQNISTAIHTNIIGTKNIADICIRSHVEEMVIISTDKAVNPTNVMGATKRLAESYIQAIGQSPKSGTTRFATIRFGNVLGSTGSVVPLFKRQLKSGGPLTVTHPDVTRYFMTVREAVELVLQASAMAYNHKNYRGNIFVLDMGEPIYIKDLAEQMIRLAGLIPGQEVTIEYTGMRPGEKLYEELFSEEESPVPTHYEGILLASPREVDLAALNRFIKQCEEAIKLRDEDKSLILLKETLPEFIHYSDKN